MKVLAPFLRPKLSKNRSSMSQNELYDPPYEPHAASYDDAPDLPHSIEAEQSVLGGLMLDASHFEAVAEVVSAGDFFKSGHRQVFTVMEDLLEQGQPIDVVTVSQSLNQRGELSAIGGLPYLTEMAGSVAGSANLAAYARIVRERSTLRQLIGAATEIAKASYNPGMLGADELLQLAEKKVLEIAEDRPKEGGFVDVNLLLKAAVEKIDELFRADSDLTGVSTGLTELNQKTSGWQAGELIVLAARPSMGKTALALNFVESALLTQAKPVLVFSLEMPADSLVVRLLSSIGRIDQSNIRTGKLTEEDWPKLEAAARKLKDKPLFIDDTAGLTPAEVRARIRKITREHGNPGLIMIDYLQLMHVAGNSDGRTQEISEISRSMKALAKEYNCPVICLSQLNRGVESRPNKRPMNSDLRESGAIEQDADVILFIYRDEYYNEESQDKGVAELIIGKQRNGEIGTCRAAFVGKYTRFENLAAEYFQQAE